MSFNIKPYWQVAILKSRQHAVCEVFQTEFFSVRKYSNAFAVLIMLHTPTAVAITTIPAVISVCDECATYQQLQMYANATASQLGGGISPPPGYPYGQVATPGVTKYIVVARGAPISFVFDYYVNRTWIPFPGLWSYTYYVAPANYYPATLEGAISQDFEFFKTKRASGLPKVTIPSVVNNVEINGTSNWPEISRAMRAIMPVVGAPNFMDFRGLLKGQLRQSITVIYEGKTYVLFDGEKIAVSLADGSEVVIKVTVGEWAGTIGPFTVVKMTLPNGVSLNIPSTSPTGLAGAQVSGVNTSTGDLNGMRITLWTIEQSSKKTPSVIVIQHPPPSPTQQPAQIYDYSDSDSW